MFIEEPSDIWDWKPSDPPWMQQAVANVVMRLTYMCYEMLDRRFSKMSVHTDCVVSSSVAVGYLKNGATNRANCCPKCIMFELLENWILLVYLERFKNVCQR